MVHFFLIAPFEDDDFDEDLDEDGLIDLVGPADLEAVDLDGLKNEERLFEFEEELLLIEPELPLSMSPKLPPKNRLRKPSLPLLSCLVVRD